MLVCLVALTANATRKLLVTCLDSDTFAVQRLQVGVLKQADKIGFAGFLQCHDSRALESQVRLEVLSDLADQTLEGELANEHSVDF